MEWMYRARRGTWCNGDAAIEVFLPGTEETVTLDINDPTVVESDLEREWIIVDEKIPGSWGEY